GADRRASQRHSFCRCRLWASLRAAERGSGSSAGSPGPPAQAFEGFRIAQLSDIHLGPFTTANYIRRCVAITNGLEPDLIALTGDYVCWDPKAQGEAVRVLAGLRAPHGVFGCMGNHEADVGIEDSITRLFAAQGIRMLRQERAPIRLGDEMLNLIGIDNGNDVAP